MCYYIHIGNEKQCEKPQVNHRKVVLDTLIFINDAISHWSVFEVTVYMQYISCMAEKKMKKTSRLNFLLAAEKLGNCYAHSLTWAPEDTAGHLRRSPLSESSLQGKLNNEMQFTAGVFSKPKYAYQNRKLYLICITMQISTVSNKTFILMRCLYAAVQNSVFELTVSVTISNLLKFYLKSLNNIWCCV